MFLKASLRASPFKNLSLTLYNILTMRILPLSIFLVFISISTTQHPQTIQFDISKILNARPVSTLKNKHITKWATGIDGGGSGDGYLTLSAAIFNGDKAPHALPDNPVFATTGDHPEIKLHYANSDSLHNQTCNIKGADSVSFTVPQRRYKAVYLALTSSEGPSKLHIRLTYKTGSVVKDFTLPDYYDDIEPGNSILSYLAHDLAKWGNNNNMTEKDHHNIEVLKVETDSAQTLESISIVKEKAGYLVFWGASGVQIGIR